MKKTLLVIATVTVTGASSVGLGNSFKESDQKSYESTDESISERWDSRDLLIHSDHIVKAALAGEITTEEAAELLKQSSEQLKQTERN